jgi:hypothetical protein
MWVVVVYLQVERRILARCRRTPATTYRRASSSGVRPNSGRFRGRLSSAHRFICLVSVRRQREIVAHP